MLSILKRFKEMLSKKGGEKGFTLIEMLIVMVIIAILLGGVIYAIAGFGGGAQSTSYDLHKQTVENACLDYWVAHDYYYPVFDGAGLGHEESGFVWINNVAGQDADDDCGLVNLCLLEDLGYFDDVPRSSALISGDNNDNCDCDFGNITCTCNTDGHYVWYWNNTDQHVISTCPVTGCTANEDGYQNVWQ